MIIIRFRISLFVVFLEKEAFYEEKYWEDFATSEVTAALRRDSLDGVQPVQA